MAGVDVGLAPRVVIVVITWNRKADVLGVLEALSKQNHPLKRMEVVIVDNASTDGTLEAIQKRWAPERIVHNPTDRAHEPAFERSTPFTGKPADQVGQNRAGFCSLTVVRNEANLGGCGGFNTGFGFIDQVIATGPGGDPDFVWLVDDDVDLPEDALESLVKTAQSDPAIGLVGSRTIDKGDRKTTIESTIYFDPATGTMGPDPVSGHAQAEAHSKWLTTTSTGAARGLGTFTGKRDVDVVSACSMLARWSGVQKVGFWDHRFFIYCDDADWCLRFARAGYRVVLDLDARVFHTPWIDKLTPARAYYADRNVLWMMQKQLPTPTLRKVMRGRINDTLRRSIRAGFLSRLFHGEIGRRTVHDLITDRDGKLDNGGPKAQPLIEALETAGLLDGKPVLVLCNQPDSLIWADELRKRVGLALAEAGNKKGEPSWVYFVRNDIPGAEDDELWKKLGRPERVVYSPRMMSKMRRQLPLLHRSAHRVVFNLTNDVPLIRGGWTIHVDLRNDGVAQVDKDTILRRVSFLARWLVTMVRSRVYLGRVEQGSPEGRYG